MANLPVVIFQFALTPYTDLNHLAWAGALIIAASVLTVTIIARIVSRDIKSS
jgi:phosphate transport system permease protein